jgi:TatA/E family protein of Tat protein translocase
MLSLSHLIIIIIAALIFLGPDKIPQFLKSCGEGIVLFKKTINMNENNQERKKINKKKTPKKTLNLANKKKK